MARARAVDDEANSKCEQTQVRRFHRTPQPVRQDMDHWIAVNNTEYSPGSRDPRKPEKIPRREPKPKPSLTGPEAKTVRFAPGYGGFTTSEQEECEWHTSPGALSDSYEEPGPEVPLPIAPKTVRTRDLFKSQHQHGIPDRERTRGTTDSQQTKVDASTTRGVKRTRSGAQAQWPSSFDINGGDYRDHDEDPPVGRLEVNSFVVSDIDAVKSFFEVRFKELTMKPLRIIVTAWVKRMKPQRSKYGAYNKKIPEVHIDHEYPPWWPSNIPYNEPSHLKRKDLIPLAVHIMLVHRQVDEFKRTTAWMAGLWEDARYYVDSAPTESFSSSTTLEFNKQMKERALGNVLKSLFDIAQSYEDYCHQYQLYEGSGNRDPGLAKLVTWQRVPRVKRETSVKRKRMSSEQPTLKAESGSETEADEPDSALSSFHSVESTCSGRKFASTRRPASPRPTDQAHLRMSRPTFVETMPSAFDQPMGHPHFTDNADMDYKPTIPDISENSLSIVDDYATAAYSHTSLDGPAINRQSFPFVGDTSTMYLPQSHPVAFAYQHPVDPGYLMYNDMAMCDFSGYSYYWL